MPIARRKVRPKEMTRFLLNPHKGCQTFQHFNGDPLYPGDLWSEEGPLEFPPRQYEGDTPGYLPSTVAYCRWYWEVVEPAEGRYDFRVIEESLRVCAERGQTLQVRLMPHGSPGQTPLPQWYRDKYPSAASTRFNRPYTVAIYDSPGYIDKWGALITEFGRRFDGHPYLECIDMAFKGAWGEGDGECSDAGVDRITGIYAKAHPVTPRCAMVGGRQMVAGIASGAGWRCDSCDDLGLWGDQSAPIAGRWNHLYDSYPPAVVKCGAQDAWKRGPVVYEPGATFMTGYLKGFDLDFIIRQDLKYHGSMISFKSIRLPEAWMGRLLTLSNDLGYRFVLRQFELPAVANVGGAVDVSCWIENMGVAPIYHPYTLAVRFTQGSRTHVYHSPADIRTWLPGDAWLEETIALPGTLKPGSVALHAGLVDPETNDVKVRFAVEGADEDGWAPLGTLEIR